MLLFKKSLQSLKIAVSLHSQNDGAVAQMVEQWTENPCVGSSILPSTTNYADNQLVTNFTHNFTHNERKVVRFL